VPAHIRDEVRVEVDVAERHLTIVGGTTIGYALKVEPGHTPAAQTVDRLVHYPTRPPRVGNAVNITRQRLTLVDTFRRRHQRRSDRS